MNMNMNYQRY